MVRDRHVPSMFDDFHWEEKQELPYFGGPVLKITGIGMKQSTIHNQASEVSKISIFSRNFSQRATQNEPPPENNL